MKKYTHLVNEIEGSYGQAHFGKFMIQMVILAVVIAIGLVLIYNN